MYDDHMLPKEFASTTSQFVTDVGWRCIIVSLARCHADRKGGRLGKALVEASPAGQCVFHALEPIWPSQTTRITRTTLPSEPAQKCTNSKNIYVWVCVKVVVVEESRAFPIPTSS